MDGTSYFFEERLVEVNQSMEVVIYPNPAKSDAVFNVGLNGSNSGTILIHEVSGKQIQSDVKKVYQGYEVSTIGWESGIYIVTITANDQQIQKRIIIQ